MPQAFYNKFFGTERATTETLGPSRQIVLALLWTDALGLSALPALRTLRRPSSRRCLWTVGAGHCDHSFSLRPSAPHLWSLKTLLESALRPNLAHGFRGLDPENSKT